MTDEQDDIWCDADEEIDDACPRCKGEGRVVTLDYESYFGAQYKPCPLCYGDPCNDQPPIS